MQLSFSLLVSEWDGTTARRNHVSCTRRWKPPFPPTASQLWVLLSNSCRSSPPLPTYMQFRRLCSGPSTVGRVLGMGYRCLSKLPEPKHSHRQHFCSAICTRLPHYGRVDALALQWVDPRGVPGKDPFFPLRIPVGRSGQERICTIGHRTFAILAVFPAWAPHLRMVCCRYQCENSGKNAVTRCKISICGHPHHIWDVITVETFSYHEQKKTSNSRAIAWTVPCGPLLSFERSVKREWVQLYPSRLLSGSNPCFDVTVDFDHLFLHLTDH